MIIGIADTTFSRVDMAEAALQVLRENTPNAQIIRYTVPGVKDLPVACQKLFEQGCEIIIALGWVGKMSVDKICGHEASTALQNVQLKFSKHILEVFVHEDEDENQQIVKEIALNRAMEHALNAIALLKGQTALTPEAGKGLRQGRIDAGPLY